MDWASHGGGISKLSAHIRGVLGRARSDSLIKAKRL